MADSESGGLHKAGIGAVLIASLAGIARFADDCGRAGKVAGSVGDDLARGGKIGSLGDDLGKAGVGLGDDLARGGKLSGALDDVSALRLGEGSLAKVAGDAAPGAGHSIEEALLDLGFHIGVEVVSSDLPNFDETESVEEGAAATVHPVRVAVLDTLDPGLVFSSAQVGSLFVLIGKVDAKGELPWGKARTPDTRIHEHCIENRHRCVVVSCGVAAGADCVSLGSGIGRLAAGRVSDSDGVRRYTELSYAVVHQWVRVGADYGVVVSRASVSDGKIVRSRPGSKLP